SRLRPFIRPSGPGQTARTSISSWSPTLMAAKSSSNYTSLRLAPANSFRADDLRPSTQQFANGPCLCDAASRRERRIAIKDLAECSQSAGVDFSAQRFKEAQRCGAIFVHAKVRQRKGPKQPAPHRTLMIRGIPFARPAAIVADIPALTLR